MSTKLETPSWQTVLKTITMPADMDVSGFVPTGWLLAKMDLAGAVLPSQHFGGPVQLVGVSDIVVSGRPRLGQCVTFRCHWITRDAVHALLDIEALSEDRGHPGEQKLLSAQLRYFPSLVEVPENIFPGSF